MAGVAAGGNVPRSFVRAAPCFLTSCPLDSQGEQSRSRTVRIWSPSGLGVIKQSEKAASAPRNLAAGAATVSLGGRKRDELRVPLEKGQGSGQNFPKQGPGKSRGIEMLSAFYLLGLTGNVWGVFPGGP